MVQAARGVVPVNTKISIKWAVKNFTEWANNRIVLVPGDNLPECHDAATVRKYLFLKLEKLMRPSTPQALSDRCLSGLNHVLKGKAPFSVLDDQHTDFRELSKTLDVVSSSCSPKELC